MPLSGLTRLIALVCLVVPLLYWPSAFDAAGPARQMLIAIAAGLGIVLFAIESFRHSAHQSWHVVFLPMLLLFAWVFASYFWSVDKGSSQLAITQFASLTVIALLASRLSSAVVLEYVLPATLISASLAGLIGIGQHFGFNPGLFRQTAPPASTFQNVNYAANFFDLITPMALVALLIQERSTKPRAIVAATAFAASLGFQIVSQSRGSWLGLAILLIALCFLVFRYPKFRSIFMKSMAQHRKILLIVLVFLLAISLSPSRTESHDKLSETFSSTPDTSSQLRLKIYQNMLAGFTDHPWHGIGYGAFIMGFAPYVDAVQPIEILNQNRIIQYGHSDPLQMFFELGLPGGLLSLLIYFMVIVMAWRIVRSDAETPKRLLGFGLLLALLASGAHACVDFPLRLPTSAFFFWLWSGIVIGLYLTIFPGKFIKFRRASLAVIGTIGLAFTIYSAYLYQGYLRANRDVRAAMFSALKNDCNTVFELTNQAMNGFGLDHLTRFWYAKVYTHCDAPVSTKLAAMDRILALAPNMALAHLTRGEILLNQGEFRKAADDFNTYRKLLPHRPEGYIGLGQVANRLNDKTQAQYWLEQGKYWLEKSR